jgi:thioesterase domain-containing protein
MAQQLTAAGERVAQVVMLDTPVPGNATLSLISRLEMKAQDIRRYRLSFFSNWAMGYVRWIREMRERRNGLRAETSETQFHNRDIEAAFYRALARYEIKPYDGPVLLLRPKLEVLYTLRDGRRIQGGRKEAREDNGWSPFIADLTIHEVAGSHDSMVLEPQVRGLAALVKRVLTAAEARLKSPSPTERGSSTEGSGASAAQDSLTATRPEGVA